MKRAKLLSIVVLLSCACRFTDPSVASTAASDRSPAQPAAWVKVADGSQGGISGCALAAETPGRWEFLVVHDNKRPGEPRLGWVTVAPGGVDYQRIPWPAGSEEAVDLEAVSPLPGRPGHFIALASGGTLFHLVVARGAASMVGAPMTIPAPDGIARPNYEGLSIQALGSALVGVWADRGDGPRAATLFWGSFDSKEGLVPQGRVEVRAPLATANLRSISDLSLDEGGVVWAAAATDPGDNGPFESTVYATGTVQVTASKEVHFQPNPHPTRLASFQRKTEAIALATGAEGWLVLGSDDENQGGWLWLR